MTKNQINLELIEIIQFCLKICDLLRHPPPMGGCVGGWVVQWVNGWVRSITKNLINLDLIEIIQFCLKIYDLLRHPHLWMGVCINGWVNGWGLVK